MAVRMNTTTANYIAYQMAYNMFTGGVVDVKVYTGTQPATAGGSHSDTLLSTINITGSWNAAASKKVTHDLTSAQDGSAAATGTAGWARLSYGGTTRADCDVSGSINRGQMGSGI